MSRNPILSDQFLFSTDSKHGRPRKVRKVMVSFERKSLSDGDEETYCLKVQDCKRPAIVKLYNLTKDNFCGTDHGKREVSHRRIICWPQRHSCMSFFSIYLSADQDCKDHPSCLVFHKNGDPTVVKNWQTVIAEHLRLSKCEKCWSVSMEGTGGREERVLLCLTEKVLAVNSMQDSPRSLWCHSFTDCNITPCYNREEKELTINCTHKDGSDKDMKEDGHDYILKTSLGDEICLGIQAVVNSPHTPLEHVGSVAQEPTALLTQPPPPCPTTPIFTKFTFDDPWRSFTELRPRIADPAPPSCSRGDEVNKHGEGARKMPLDKVYDNDLRHRGRMYDPSKLDSIQHKRPLRRSWSYGTSLKGVGNLSVPDTGKVKSSSAIERRTYNQHKQWYKSFMSEISGSKNIFPTSDRKSVYDRQDLPSPKFERPSGRNIPGLPKKKRSMVDDNEDYYWTSEICFSLQKILENQHPSPDTMKLDWKKKARLTFNLLTSPGPMLAGGWQELADKLYLTSMEVSMIEHFSLVNQNTPVDVLLLHWQFVYNKQVRMKLKDPSFQFDAAFPPCTQEQLVEFLTDMNRLDVIQICGFTKPPS